MNSWKTINFSRQYGSQRLFILSSLTMLLTFIFVYVPAQFLFNAYTFYDNYFILFIFGLWLIYPLHKLLHYLPIAHHVNKVKKGLSFRYGFVPKIHVTVFEPISKWQFILALFTPFIVINSMLIFACYIYPHYLHYFTIMLAFHVGLCLPDLICAKNVLFAPNSSYIEEDDDGIQILLHKN
ncbi:DUF3267 domain-containing protein [Bacillus sp. S/N-304-OC-R1]|uniref:DUF3267 domain-containing protein n=1 Tax=Bacillus sp. S/N-304-OC-R1 TaxID=2758034 RepID=UPI001C8EAA85|nr:DUF3267 domain-containing protein [Bacillus sp. S/N-304-OC-R1]MBY0123079.1 DUF3267 domain-containing protein [Bacillus sp. S/N-304-OC-R1]